MNFGKEFDQRLRRLCEVNDDSREVAVEQEREYSGHCSECEPYYDTVSLVTVYDNEPGDPVGQVLGQRRFYNLEEFFEELKGVEL